jgi:hypothetical protein
MKLKFNGILALVTNSATNICARQGRKGVVFNAGMPIPGVSVLVKGTNLAHKLILTVNM